MEGTTLVPIPKIQKQKPSKEIRTLLCLPSNIDQREVMTLLGYNRNNELTHDRYLLNTHIEHYSNKTGLIKTSIDLVRIASIAEEIKPERVVIYTGAAEIETNADKFMRARNAKELTNALLMIITSMDRMMQLQVALDNNDTRVHDELYDGFRSYLYAFNTPMESRLKRARIDAEAAEEALPGDPLCVACKENKASYCFLPCYHQVACDKCASAMQESCPVCRGKPDELIRPIISEIKE